MYVDYFEKMQRAARDNKASARVALFKANLETSMAHYRTLLSAPAYDGENLRSLAKAIGAATARLATSQSGLYPPIDRSSGARTKLMGVTGKADIEAVAVCGRAPRGTYKSQPSEPNAYGMDESVPHADVTIHDLGVITSIVMQNTPTGRELDPDVTSLQIWEDLPPDVGITNYARGGANVVTDDYGQVYVRRLIGSVPVASDGSAHYQVTGGLPLTLRLPDTATSLSKHLPRTLNEHFMSSPGESVHEAMRCDLFDGFCAGCHSSLSGKPLDSALKPDVLTRASDTQSYSQAPTHLDLPPNQRGNPTGP